MAARAGRNSEASQHAAALIEEIGLHPLLVLVAAGFAAYRDVEGARFASVAVLWVLYEEMRTRLEATNDARAWAPQLAVRDVEVDRDADPALVTVTVTGTEEPPEASLLAGSIAEDLREAVRVEVIYVPIREGIAPAP